MNILGLSCFYHDSAASFLVDGKVMAAAAEERFSRKKHDNGFPVFASEFCLATSGKTIYDIDAIAFYEKPILKFERVIFTHFKYFPRSLKGFLQFMPGWINQNLSVPFHIQTNLSTNCPVYFVKHHESHAASAFYPSEFEKSIILTADGVGDCATTGWGIGVGHKISMKQEIKFPHSIGLLYSTFTTFLGFNANGGEGKVMGLAAYGKPTFKKQFGQIIHVHDDGSFKLDLSYFGYMYGLKMFSQKMVETFGDPREPESALTERDYDIASTLQLLLEEILIKMVRHLIQRTSIKNLCMGGGVALNCVANGKLLEKTDIEGLYVQPASGDDGGSLGAALFLHHQILGNQNRIAIKDYYLGPEYSNIFVLSRLKQESSRIRWEELDEETLLKKTAKTIYDDKVIGWFQNRMEFGPRALGNRSILANPTNPKMKDIVNHKIKKREGFRPFAPAVMDEHRDDYFVMKQASPFMLVAASLQPDKTHKLPAIKHVDDTARIQTVNHENNPLFYKLLRHLKEISGIPIVLNTSFNLRGEPIVCTPEDAIDCFLRSSLDILVINNFWIEKR